MGSFIDKDISAMLWKPIFFNGDKRVLDLIIAYRKGWYNIRYSDELRDWQGINPECELGCLEVIPRTHDSIGKLVNLVRLETDCETLCVFKNNTVSVNGVFYRHSSFADNLLHIYMEHLEKRYG